MKQIVMIAAIGALAACSEAEAPAPEPTDTATAAAPLAIDGGPLAGSYSTTDAEGGEAVWTLAEDGTFTLVAEGVDPVAGTYTNTPNEDGTAKFCADPEGDEAGETCYAISVPGEDGSWTATDPDGNVLTVKRAA